MDDAQRALVDEISELSVKSLGNSLAIARIVEEIEKLAPGASSRILAPVIAKSEETTEMSARLTEHLRLLGEI